MIAQPHLFTAVARKQQDLPRFALPCQQFQRRLQARIVEAQQRVIQNERRMRRQHQIADGQPRGQIQLVGSSAAEIEQLMNSGSFQIQPQPSDAMLSIRSALRYKYKPVIRYSLELFRSFEKTIGQLRVSFRTQSERLKSELTDFLKLWAELENSFIVRFFPEGISYTIEDGRFTRTFRLPEDKENCTNDEIARAISEYIKMFDEILKIYFENIGSKREAAALATRKYREYLWTFHL